jgi:N-acetylglucosamine-6-phosphate deacetylase
MKGVDRLCLVTDANRALDMPPGRYRFGAEADDDWFESDGRVGFVPGGGLASSVVGMDAMVRNMKSVTSCGIASAVRMGSLTPARRAGLDADIGSLEAGKRADVLCLDGELRVQRVVIGGREIDRSDSKEVAKIRAT